MFNAILLEGLQTQHHMMLTVLGSHKQTMDHISIFSTDEAAKKYKKFKKEKPIPVKYQCFR